MTITITSIEDQADRDLKAAIGFHKLLTVELRGAYQDGAQFYREEDDSLIAEYPGVVQNDHDMHGAQSARRLFAIDHPDFIETAAAAGEAPEDDPEPVCSDPGGHVFKETGTAYGGDDERWMGEGRSLCIHCGADGDA